MMVTQNKLHRGQNFSRESIATAIPISPVVNFDLATFDLLSMVLSPTSPGAGPSKLKASSFRYTLTRPYPFQWFTPVVLTGGLVAAVLVSFISVGTSGYELAAISSSNPNQTESSAKTWFSRKFGTIFGNTGPSCDSATIPVDSVLYTTNRALPYTLTAVTIDGVTQGSIVYHNNPLKNCKVNSISMNFETVERPAENIAIQQQDAMVACHIDCQVDTPQGVADVELRTTYDYLQNDPSISQRYTIFPGETRRLERVCIGQSRCC